MEVKMGICISRNGVSLYLGQAALIVQRGLFHARFPRLGIVQWVSNCGWVIEGATALENNRHRLGQMD